MIQTFSPDTPSSILEKWQNQNSSPDKNFSKEKEISQIAQENIPHEVPEAINQLKNTEFPAKSKFSSVDEVFKLLMDNACHPKDKIDQWVYTVLKKSFYGNSNSLDKHLAYLKHADPENQEALLSAAYALAKQMGHEAVCRRLLIHQRALLDSSSRLFLDKTKEVNTNLINALVQREIDQRVWYQNPVFAYGASIVGATWLLSNPGHFFTEANLGRFICASLFSGIAIGILEKISPNFFGFPDSDLTRLNIIKIKLQNGKEDAIDDVRHIKCKSIANKALKLLGINAIKEGNFLLAESISKKMGNSSRSLWKKGVKKYLNKNPTEKALDIIPHIRLRVLADAVLTQIGEKALKEGNFPLAECIAKKMTYTTWSDSLWQKTAVGHLSKGDAEKAFDVAQHIKYPAVTDAVLTLIEKKALAEGNLPLAEHATKKKRGFSILDTIHEIRNLLWQVNENISRG